MRPVHHVCVLLLFTFSACNRQSQPPAGSAAGGAPAAAGQNVAGAAPQAAASAVPAAVASGQSASDQARPDAKDLLRQVSDFYRQAKTFQVEYVQKVSIDFNGMKNTQETHATLTAERPNRFSMRPQDPQQGIEAVCDGKQLSISVAPLKQFSQSAAPASLDELTTNPLLMGGGGGGRGPLLELFSSDPYGKLMEGVTKADNAGREKIGDVEAHHLKFEQAQADWDLWVAASGQPHVLQASFDPTKSLAAFAAGNEQLKNMKMSFVQQYQNWQFDKPAVDQTFVFEPPVGAKKVDNFFAGGAGRAEPVISPLVGKPAPDVEQELLDGDHFSLKDQKDKQIVILDFWATWCGPCVREMPLVAKVAGEYRDKGVALYCVNQREEADTIRGFLEKEKLDVTVSLDANGAAGNAYGVQGIPTLVLIDKAGVVQSVHIGFSPDIAEKLKQELDAVLAGKDLAAEALSARKAKDAELHAEGLEEVWSKPGVYQGVAVAADGRTIVAANAQQAEFFDASGNKTHSVNLPVRGGMLRYARLTGNEPGELLLFGVWAVELTAVGADGSKLWTQSSGIDDVWAADLDSDGKDEVIVGYNGGAGLHVFDSQGERRWKDTSIANVWHVTAGDIDGDKALEVVTTSAIGKVHVFDAQGKNLATLDPGIYANMVRVFRSPGESADSVLVVGGGPGSLEMVAMDGQGKQRWKTTLPGTIRDCGTLAFAPGTTWAAGGAMSGVVWVVDVSTGNLIAGRSGLGMPQVAWATDADDRPILLTASTSGLTAWRVKVDGTAEAGKTDEK